MSNDLYKTIYDVITESNTDEIFDDTLEISTEEFAEALQSEEFAEWFAELHESEDVVESIGEFFDISEDSSIVILEALASDEILMVEDVDDLHSLLESKSGTVFRKVVKKGKNIGKRIGNSFAARANSGWEKSTAKSAAKSAKKSDKVAGKAQKVQAKANKLRAKSARYAKDSRESEKISKEFGKDKRRNLRNLKKLRKEEITEGRGTVHKAAATIKLLDAEQMEVLLRDLTTHYIDAGKEFENPDLTKLGKGFGVLARGWENRSSN